MFQSAFGRKADFFKQDFHWRKRPRFGEKSYTRKRTNLETLEPRLLLSSATFAGLTFQLDTANSTTDTQLGSLFSQGTSASVTTVAFTGDLNGFSQSIHGNFSITANSANTFTITASNLSFNFPSNVVTVSNANASFSLSSSGFSGSITTPNSAAINLSNMSLAAQGLTMSWDTASGHDNEVKLGMTGATLTVGTQQAFTNGSFSLETSNSNVALTIGAAEIKLNDAVDISGLTGSLTISSTGISGSSSANVSTSFDSYGASFSGNFGFSINTASTSDSNLQLTATGVTITVGSTHVHGNMSVEMVASSGGKMVGASLTNVTANFTDGTNNFVSISGDGATAAFFFQSDMSSGVETGSFAGAVKGTVTVTAPNVSASGTAVLEVNTGANVFTVPDPLDSANNSLTIPGGPTVLVYARNMSLNFNGKTITGDFSFTLATDANGHVVVDVSAANAGGTFGSTVISNASGNLVISAGSGGTGSFTGSISGDASFASGGGTLNSGTFTVSIDSSGNFSISGSNVDMIVLGQHFTGAFSIDAESDHTTFTLTDASLLFADGALTVTDLTGSVTVPSSGQVTGNVTGTVDTTVGSATISGGIAIMFGATAMTLVGTNDLIKIGEESISGNFSFSEDDDNGNTSVAVTASNVNASLGNGLIVVAGGAFTLNVSSSGVTGSVSGTVSAGTGVAGVNLSGSVAVIVASDSITVTGTHDTLAINGTSFSANFSFYEDAAGLELGISGVSLSLGGGLLSVSNAAGTLLIPADQSGVSGSFSAGFLSTVAGFHGDLAVEFDGSSFTLDATNVSFTVGTNTVTGDMQITQNGSELDLAASNLTASIAGGLVTITPPASGSASSTLKLANGVFSGTFSGTLTAGSIASTGFSGIVMVTVDPSNGITVAGVNDTITIAGQSLTAGFTFSQVNGNLQLHITNLNFTLGSVLSISNANGDLAITSDGVTGSASGTVSTSIANFSGNLGVAFAPGLLSISGTNDRIGFGDQFLSGSFNFTQDASGIELNASDLFASLGNGLVTVSNGSGTLMINAISSAVTGSFSGTVATGGALSAAGIGFAGALSVAVGNGVVTASGEDDTLTLPGVSLMASFNFFEDSKGLELTVRSLSFSLGSVLSIVGASGTLLVNASGISGFAGGTISSSIAGLSGSLGVTFGGGVVKVTGTNDKIAIGDQSVTGDFAFTLNSDNSLTLNVSNLNVYLGNGLITVGAAPGATTGATGSLAIANGNVSGSFNGYVSAGSASSVGFSGQVAVAVNSTSITASGTNDTITIAGQSVSGDFGFSEDLATKALDLTVANMTVALGGVITVTNVHGNIVIESDGIVGSIVGTLSQSIAGLTAISFGVAFAPGSLAITAAGAALVIGGQSISGDFEFLDDSTGLHLTSTNMAANVGSGLVTVSGGSANLNIVNGQISGSFAGNIATGGALTAAGVGFSGVVAVNVTSSAIIVTGTNDTLTIGGFQLNTNFNFFKDASGLELSVSNLNLSLGSALAINNASGQLLVTSSGVTGNAGGTIAANIPGVMLSGTLGVSFGGRVVSIAGVNDSLTIAGQTISGDFTFTQSAGSLALTASNFAATLGGGLVKIMQGSGELDVVNGQFSGSFTGNIQAGTVGGAVSFSGGIAVSVSNSAITAATPAGTVDTLTIGGQSVSAAFSFYNDSKGLELTVSDMTASLGGVLTLKDGGGTLLVNSSGVSGSASGTLSSSFNGFSFSGTLGATFAPGSFKLSGTNDKLIIGDQTLSGDFSFLSDSTGVHLSASNFMASLGGGLVTVSNGSGNLTIVNGNITGSFAGSVAAGSSVSGVSFSGGITVTIAPGSITAVTLTGQPATLTVGSTSLSAGFAFTEDANGLELSLNSVNFSLGSGIIAVNNASGMVLVNKSGVTGSISGGLSANVPGVTFNASNFSITFAPGTLSIGGTGVSLTVGGQTLSGNFQFTQQTGSVALAISNLSLSLGSIVTVNNGTGSFTMNSTTGISGSASGNVAINGLSNVSFGGTFSVAVGNSAVSVSGTGDTLTVFGQTISGDFSFTQSGSNVNLHVASLSLALGGGLVTVSGGAADFAVTSSGVTGTASGNLGVGSAESGISFSGAVAVAVTTTGVSVTGTNIHLVLGGQTLTANASFQRDSATGLLDVTITNLKLSNPAVTLSGTLTVMPSGMSGTLTGQGTYNGVTGTITASFGNGSFTLMAGVSTTFSETFGPIAISGQIAAQGSTSGTANISLTDLLVSLGNGLMTISGGSATLNYVNSKLDGTISGSVALNAIPGLSVSGNVSVTFTQSGVIVVGTNDSIALLGQTIKGDFTFVDNDDGTVHLTVNNLNIALGSTVSLTGGTANFTLSNSNGVTGIKGTGSGNLALSVPGVSFSSAFGLTIDTTAGNSTFTVAANPMTLTIGNTSLAGSFVLSKVALSDNTSQYALVASNISMFLGDGSTGVQISNAGGTILITPNGIALDIYGAGALQGISGLTLNGTLHIRINNTGAAVNTIVSAPGTTVGSTVTQTLKLTKGENDVSGTATLVVGTSSGTQFVSLTGGFSFATTKTTTGTVTNTKLLIGAAGLNAFLGAGTTNSDGSLNTTSSSGVYIQNANLGLVVFSTKDTANPTANTSKYALSASGAASLLGISGLTLAGTLALQSDTAGAVDEEVDVPDPQNPGSTLPVSVKFSGNTQAFSGSATLAIASPGNAATQFLSLSGNFSFAKTVTGNTTELDVSGSNISAFVGVGGSNPIGLQLANGSFGITMLQTGGAAMTYALGATGTVSVVGLPGLYAGGTLSVDVSNMTTAHVNPINSTDTIAAGASIMKVSGLTFAILDSSGNHVLSISADATIQKIGSVVDINTTNAEFALNVSGSQLIDIRGAAEFTIGADGFKIGAAGYSITSWSLLGSSFGSTNTISGANNSGSSSNGNSSTGSNSTLATLPTPTGTPRKLGPLSLYNLQPIFKNFSFSGGVLSANIGLSADAAVLTFGSNTSSNPGGTTAIMSNVAGSVNVSVGVDLSSFRVTSFGSSGKFSFSAGEFVLNVPNVVNVDAKNILISYDPNGGSTQQLFAIGSATVLVPIGQGGASGIKGTLASTMDSNGNVIPGLAVYGDHFQLGTGTITYVGTIGFGGAVQFVNPFVSISNLSAGFDGSLSFNGSISIGAGSVLIGPSSFQLTGSSVTATLTHTNGDWGFNFTAGTVGLKIGGILNITATNVYFDPTASGSETLIALSSLQVTASLSKLTLTGIAGSNAGQISITGDGTVSLPQNFSVGMQIGAGTSGDLGWPSWIPIQISSILLTWPDFSQNAANFTLTFSASVHGSIGPIELSGELDDVTIDIGKLTSGQFPITGIGSAAITAEGNVFGGQIDGKLVLGVIKVDAGGHRVNPLATTYDHTVFYCGVEAGFQMPELGGAEIRFGLTQYGPLEAYIQIDADVMLIAPADIALKSLYGGITFDATPFPSISSAKDLKNGVFSDGEELSVDQWELQLQQEAANQAGAGGGGYLFSITNSADATALDSGLLNADLISTFVDNGHVLTTNTLHAGAKKATVYVETPGLEWLIVDGANYYVVSKNLTGSLDVSQYRFVIDPNAVGSNGSVASTTRLVADLNSGLVTTNIINAFKAYGITLPSSGATIAINAPAAGQAVSSWTISVNGYKYTIIKDANSLLSVATQGGSMSALNGVIRIEAAVTLGFYGVPTSEFSGTGDIIIETDGKILLNAFVNFGQSSGSTAAGTSFNFRAFIDLSHAAEGTVTTLFYFEQDITLPSGIVMPQLVVAAGATFARTDADNNLIIPGGANADADAVGFGIQLNGEIVYTVLPGSSLILDGQSQITFTDTQATLEFNASLSATIANFIQANNVVNAAGSFTVQYAGDLEVWGAAELSFDSGSIPFLSSAGISANAEIFLRINSDDQEHDINFLLPTSGQAGQFTEETFNLQPLSFGLYLVGQLDFNKGPIAFDIDGLFDVDFKNVNGGWIFDVFAFGELDLSVAGQSILTMHAIGMLQIDDNGFAAMLAIDTSADATLLNFNFDFTLFVNTTGQNVSYTLPTDLTSILKQMDGQVTAGNSLLDNLETELGNLANKYGSGNGSLAVANAGTLTLNVPAGMPLLAQDGTISGFASPGAYLVIQGAGDLSILNTVTLTGSFLIKASSDGVSIAAQGVLHAGPLANIAAVGSIDISASGLVAAISLASTINLGGIASFNGAASLEINTTGVDQQVKEYTFDSGSGTVSNTPSTVTIAGATRLRIYVAGDLKLAGFFNLEGQFSLVVSQDPTFGTAITVAMDAHLDAFFGISLAVEGSAEIITGGSNTGPGFVGSLTISVGLNLASILTIDGTVTLQINTFSEAMNIIDPNNQTSTISVAAGVHLTLNANVEVLSVLSFHATGSIVYDTPTHIFTLSFDVTEHINLFIFSQDFEIGGWVNSTGQFAVTIYGDFHIGVGGIASLDGDGHLSIAYTNGSPNFSGPNYMPITPTMPNTSGKRVLTIGGGAELSGEVFGFTIGSVGIDFLVDSNLNLSFSIHVHLNFFLFSITISFTVNVGSFGGSKPPSVYLGGTTTNHQVDPSAFTGGPLMLNVGQYASYRNYDSSDSDESVYVTGKDYDPTTGKETLYVTIDGYTQVFTGVTKLIIPGAGSNNIQIDNSVKVPVTASTGGVGKTGTIIDNGTGVALLTGGAGNDLIESGSGSATINSGGGSDTIVVGSGGASVNTTGPNAGYTKILWNSDTSGPLNIVGSGNHDELIVTADTPGTVYAGGETLSVTNGAITGSGKVIHTLNGGGTLTTYFTGLSDLLISAPGGNNTINLNNLSATGLSNVNFSYGSTHAVGNVVNVTSSAANDVFTMNNTISALPTIPSPIVTSAFSGSSTGNNPVTGSNNSTPSTVNVDNVTQNSTAINLYGASSTAGDKINFNSGGGADTYYITSAIIPTTLEGNDPTKANKNDTTYYYVGYQGAGKAGTLKNITALVTVVGTTGNDVLIMDDSAETNNVLLSMTDTQVASDAFGTGGRLVYNNSIDNMNFLAGSGENDYTIQASGGSVHTQINTGSSDNNFIINAPLLSPLAINGNSSTFGGDTLTVNGTLGSDAFVITPNGITGAGAPITYTNVDYVTVNGNGGNDSFILNGNTVPMTINGSSGNDTFVINATSRTTIINGGDGTDSFTINGNGAAMTINGANSNDTFNVNGNSSQLTLNGGIGANTFNVVSNAGVLSLNGGSGKSASNAFNILGNTGLLNIITGTGISTFNISNISSGVHIDSTGALSSYVIAAPLYSPITIVGGTNLQSLVVNGTGGNDNFLISPTSITGLGAAINYSGFAAVTINGGGGNDTFTVNDNSAATTINAGDGDSTFNILKSSYAITLNTGTGSSLINIGSTSSQATSKLSPITAAITINGSGDDTLNISDAVNTIGLTGTLSSTTLTGFLTAGLTYSGIANLNLLLGSGADLLTILGTNAATLVAINTGAGNDTVNIRGIASAVALTTGTGANTINIGNIAPATGSTVTQIQAPLTIVGSGSDTLNMDDTANFNAATVNVTSSTITGLAMADAGITYSGLAAFNLALGTGGDTVNVLSTQANSATHITGGTGGDTFNVQSTTGTLQINTGIGTNAIMIGSLAPTLGGVLDAIQGGISLIGGGTDAVTIDDTASTSDKTGTLTASTLTGLGMGAVGITYSLLDSLLIETGNGNDTLTLNGTAAGTPTTLITGSGNDTINLLATGTAATSIQTGAGNDIINVTATTGTTAISLGTGTNTLNAGGATHTLNNINGTFAITGGGTDTINLDDTGDTTANTGTLTASTVTGFSPATISYGNDTGLVAFNLSLGSGGNTLNIADTNALGTTTVNTGTGADNVTITTTSGTTNINTGASNDTIRVKATNAATTINTGTGTNNTLVESDGAFTLNGIQGALAINGTGTDNLTLEDSGSHLTRTGSLSATALTGFGTAGINYAGIANLVMNLGNGGDTLTVTNTAANTLTTINASSGNDAFIIANTGGTTNLNVGTGTSTVNVQGISAPTTVTTATGGHDAITVSNNGITDTIHSTLTLAGNGTDTLLVDDSATTTAKTGTLSASTLTGLSSGTINYAGIASMNVLLGSGNDTFTVAATNAATPTSINAGAGHDAIIIASDASALVVNAGTGNNTITVQTTNAATRIISAAGANDTVTLSNNHLLNALNGQVTLVGNGSDIVTLDDNANTTGNTGIINTTSITGFSPASINYIGVQTLNMNLGSGDDNVTINDTAAATATLVDAGAGDDTIHFVNDSGTTGITTGTGNNTVTVDATDAATTITSTSGGTTDITLGGNHHLSSLLGSIAINGNGSDNLSLDDTANSALTNSVIAASSITGLSTGEIDYTGINNLNLNFGSGNDTLSITGTGATSTTLNTNGGDDSIGIHAATNPLAVNLGTGTNSVAINTAASSVVTNITAPITITGSGTDRLSIDDTGDTTAQNVAITSHSVTGLTGGTINYTGLANLILSLGAGNDTLSVTSITANTATFIDGGAGTNTAALNFASDFNGLLALRHMNSTTLNVNGNLNGSISTDGDLPLVRVTGNIAQNATLDTTGKINNFAVGGSNNGGLTASSVGTMTLGGLTPNSNGVVWTSTDNGITRTLSVLGAGGTVPTGVSFTVFYDNTGTSNPLISIRVNDTDTTGERFDLVLSAPADAGIDLSRLDSTGDAETRIRNVVVDGSILRTVTANEISSMGYDANATGGIVLPHDALANVSVRDDMYSRTITAQSFQGLSFGQFIDINNKVYTISSINSGAAILRHASTLDAKGNVTTPLAIATEQFIVAVGSDPVELFTAATKVSHGVMSSTGLVSRNGLFLTDATPLDGALVTVNFTQDAVHNQLVINNLTTTGDIVNIDTALRVENISTYSSLGTINLRAGKSETLNSLSAYSITGNINLNGGTLAGTLESTYGDIGSTTGTTLRVNMGTNAAIDAAGNIYSTISLDGSLNGGMIAAGGDIGAFLRDTNGNITSVVGGIKTKAGKNTAGDIITLGNIDASISLGGNFSGTIAAQGTPVTGLSGDGILGSIKLSSLLAGGSILSNNQIGDTALNTAITATKVLGTIAAQDTARIAKPTGKQFPAGHVFSNLTPSSTNAQTLNNVWLDTNGNPLTFADLSLLLSQLDAITFTS